jgi:1,4-dihydroxy-2-naphthoyl-CoA hydrolase
MHFRQLLRWCHEAYEESLERFGVAADEVFPVPGWARSPANNTGVTTEPLSSSAGVALPIVHCSADFLRPLVCGDPLDITLTPLQLDSSSFEVRYRFSRSSQEGAPVARGVTRHVAIEANSRARCALPESIERWLAASARGA